MIRKKKLFFIVFLSIIYFFNNIKISSATVGTDEGFYSFGYYKKTQDVILFYAGQEGSPIIWSYNLITNNLSKNYFGIGEDFDKALDNLKEDITPLKKVELKNTQLVITQEKLPTERRLYEGEDYMFDVYPTKITIQDLKNSTTQTKILESCFQDLPVLLDGVYEYLDKNISIIVFRHQGVCFEGGYMNETAFFFPKPKSETSGPPLNIYTIQVVAGKAIKNLDSIKNKLIEFGQEPSIEKFVDKSNISWYRLRTGAYVYRSDAEEVAKKLKYLLSVEPFVLAIKESENREVVERLSTDKPDILKDVILPEEVKRDKDTIQDQNANKNIETNINNTLNGQKEFKIDSSNKVNNKDNYNGNIKIDNIILLIIIVVGFIVILFLGLLLFMDNRAYNIILVSGTVLTLIAGGMLAWQLLHGPKEEGRAPQIKVQEESFPKKNKSGNQIETFVPKGWRIIAKAEGDLNKDNLSDTAAVIEQEAQNLSLGEAAPRKLLIVSQKDNGTYELSIQSDKAILKANEGGVFGDPLEGLAIENNSLLIKFYGGSSERWAQTYRFRYQDNGWYLIGATLTNYDTETGEGTIEDYNLLTGKMKKTTGKIISSANKVGGIKEEWVDMGKKELLNLQNFDVHGKITWQTYRSEMYGFIFQFPPSFALASSTETGFDSPYGGQDAIKLQFLNTVPGRQISTSAVMNIFRDAADPTNCLKEVVGYEGNAQRSLGTYTADAGVEFHVNENGDCATGQCLGIIQYSTWHDDRCYRAVLVTWTTNPGHFIEDAQTMKQVERNNVEFIQELNSSGQEVLSTFTFIPEQEIREPAGGQGVTPN